MTDSIRPNLFFYATSELSQDAFICWLAAWADLKWQHTDSALHKTARAFVASMIRKGKPDYDLASIKTVDIKRQADKLDVLIKVNQDEPDRLAILVEDKTHTSNHSDQLNRYYQQVKAHGYAENQMIPLYFKTGYQSKFDTLGVFKTYLRRDFLEVLREGKAIGVDNAIYDDFLFHLEKIDAAIRQFTTKDPSAWEDDDWKGFFMKLYDSRSALYEVIESDGANWGYVANPSGGFFGYWWYFKRLDAEPFMPYLQLEYNSLCFKVMVEDGIDRRTIREQALKRIEQAALQQGITVARPERMGNGKFMTVAKWPTDYRVTVESQFDMEATIMNLRKAQNILDAAFVN